MIPNELVVERLCEWLTFPLLLKKRASYILSDAFCLVAR